MAESFMRTFTTLVATIATVAVVAVSIVLVVLPAVGRPALGVLTGSMAPTIPTGSLVVLEPIDPGQVSAGDIVTFAVDGVRVTHRVVSKDVTTGDLTTKGDANAVDDLAPVPAEAIQGRVWFHVPYLGTVIQRLQTSGAAPVLAGVVGIVFVAAAVIGRQRARRAKNLADQAPEPRATESTDATEPSVRR